MNRRGLWIVLALVAMLVLAACGGGFEEDFDDEFFDEPIEGEVIDEPVFEDEPEPTEPPVPTEAPGGEEAPAVDDAGSGQVLEDDLTAPGAFEAGQDGGNTAAFGPDGLTLTIPGEATAFNVPFTGEVTDAYEVEVVVSYGGASPDTSGGFYFGADASGDYFAFEVDSSPSFSVFKFVGGEFIELQTWTPVDGDVDYISLAVDGQALTAMINGNTVFEATDADLQPGALGLIAETFDVGDSVTFSQFALNTAGAAGAVAEAPASDSGDGDTTTAPPPPASGEGPWEVVVDYVPVFEDRPCPDLENIPDNTDCGVLIVPENRTRAGSPMIELAVAVLRVPGGAPNPEPIIILTGGPGQDAVSFVDAFALEYYPGHDIIYIDQRGTGRSLPSLNCPEVEDGEEDGERACRERLVAEGIDLTAYNTPHNAADINDLRFALGYDQAILFGTSYGTRLGLAVMQYYPDGVRSAILDSVYPPNLDVGREDPLANYGAVQLLIEKCGADAACNGAYPNLGTVLEDAIVQLNEDPEAPIWGDDLLSTIVQAMYVNDLIPYLPRMIYDASEYDTELFDQVAGAAGSSQVPRSGTLWQADEPDYSDSEGMFTSVVCNDDYAFSDFDAAAADLQDEIPEPYYSSLVNSIQNVFDTCAYWGAGISPASEDEPVESDVPALLLTGEYDPTTPPSWAYTAAETLTTAWVVEFPAYGHSVASYGECPDQVIRSFLRDPFSQPDTSCVATLPPVDWILPNDEIELDPVE